MMNKLKIKRFNKMRKNKNQPLKLKYWKNSKEILK